MTMLDRLHDAYAVSRRATVLADLLAQQVPQNASVLDVGCGDGYLASLLLERRPDLSIRGVDVLVRGTNFIPIDQFDGVTLPLDDDAMDAVTIVDVLHHCEDPRAVLRECARVARTCVIIKDHLVTGVLARPTLRYMDRVGNERFGVALPFNYMTPEEWDALFTAAGLTREYWQDRLPLYPFPLSMAFNRRLHFLARLSSQ